MADVPQRTIPRFGLYGEPVAESDDVGFVHVETVWERSHRHDWRIDHHRHGHLHQVALFLHGEVQVTIDGTERAVTPPGAVVLPPGTVHGFRFSPDTDGYIVTIADGLLDVDEPGRAVAAVLFARPAVVVLESTTAARLRQLLGQALVEHEESEPGSGEVRHWLVRSALTMLARHAGAETADGPPRLVARFRRLVDEHHAAAWPVAAYATALHVSPSTLERSVRDVTGTTPFELIQRRLELEARRRLAYLDAPVSEIGRQLGFGDPSYFSRWIRRRTGSSPQQLRSRLRDTAR